MIRPVRNPQEHQAALARIDALMDAKDDDVAIAELQVLAILVDRYEREAFPIDPPTPVEAIRFRMDEMGYTQADLARLLGSRSRASEIMTGVTKNLSLNMIRRLHNEWRIPAEALIRRAA